MSNASVSIKSNKVDVQFDRGRDWRARIGFVLVPTDGVIESEMFKLAPPGVGVHFTRVPGSEDVTVENLFTMEDELEDCGNP